MFGGMSSARSAIMRAALISSATTVTIGSVKSPRKTNKTRTGSTGCSLYRDAAKKLFHREGELEIDAGAPVSKADPEDGGDEGAYVQAWVWVPDYEIPGQTPAEKKLRSRKKGGN
jgi:hypothetical protein